MYAVGISQSKLLPVLIDPAPRGAMLDKTKKARKYARKGESLGAYRRFAAMLYEAHLCQNGKWIWQPTNIICETRDTRSDAWRDAVLLAERYGQCRVYEHGLGKIFIK